MAKHKSDELKIVGKGMAERARKSIAKRKKKNSSLLDQVRQMQMRSMGIKSKKAS